MKKVLYSWEEIWRFCTLIHIYAERDNFIPDVICPVIRGGLVPGTMLSHIFSQPRIIPIQWQTRDLSVREINLSKLRSYNKILIVEDIVDTGKTINEILKYFKKWTNDFAVASLIKKETAVIEKNVKVFSGISNVTGNQWHQFPWESKGP